MMLHISSVIVQVAHTQWLPVNRVIAAIVDASISASDESLGKLIVILEAGSLRDTEALIDTLKAINGVISATMVYHHSELIADLNQPLYEQAL